MLVNDSKLVVQFSKWCEVAKLKLTKKLPPIRKSGQTTKLLSTITHATSLEYPTQSKNLSFNQISLNQKIDIKKLNPLLVAGLAATAMLLHSATASAACSGVNLQVGYDFDYGAKTGIAPPDAGSCVAGSSTAPAGDDYCSGNTTGASTGDYVIRTNDSGVATLKYTFNVGVVHNNYTIVVDMPRTGDAGATSTRSTGLDIATWSGLPSVCSEPGSAITDNGHKLTCNLGTIDATGGQITVAVPASFKVSPRALNNETFSLKSTESSTGGTNGVCAVQPAASSQALKISARPKIDIKTTTNGTYPTIYKGEPGFYVDYLVYVDALNQSLVGGEAVQNPLNFNFGVSSNVPTSGVKFVSIFDYWTNTTNLTTTAPADTLIPSGGTIPISLASETPACTFEFLVPGGACAYNPVGEPARLTLHSVRTFVPLTDFPALGGQINFTGFINSNGSTAQAPVLTPPASGVGTFSEPISNNSVPITVVKTGPGTFAKYTDEFTYDNGTQRPAGSDLNGTVVRMPGESSGDYWCVSGVCKQYPGRSVQAMIHAYNKSPAPWTNTIICDKFDNRGMVLTRYPRKAGAASHLFPTNMPGDTIVGMYVGIAQPTIPGGYTVEVASTGTPGYPSNSQQCGDGDAAWVDANTVTDYTNYNLVRIKLPTVNNGFTAGSSDYISPVFNFTVPATAPTAGYIGNQMMIRADQESFGGTLGSFNISTFDPATNVGVYVGERFQVVKGIVRATKEAYNNVLGGATSTIGAGKSVTFRLSPSYTAAPGVSAPNANIDVTDTLPLNLTYIVGTARLCPAPLPAGPITGTPFEPSAITLDGSGKQVLKWTLPNVALNSAVTPICVDVETPLTTVSGTVLTNTVTVAAPAVDLSTDAERSATKALTVDNVAGFFVTKKISVPLIPKNGTYFNTLEIANLKSSTESNIDVIDVLPRVGDPRTPTSAFSGTRFLTGPVTGPAITVRYTNAAVGAAPTALNSTLGGAVGTVVAADFAIPFATANGWCLQSEFGTAGCPANFAAVTGFRVQVPAIAGNSSVQLNAPMGTAGNLDGNKYTNRFAMAAVGFGPLFSNDVVATVKQAQISGKVYVDSNANASLDGAEPPIAGVTVVLCNVAAPIPCPAANIVQTKITDATGAYTFNDLNPGTYFIRETQPTDLVSAGANIPGTAGGTSAGPDAFNGVTLVTGQTATDYNFGETGATVSGNVFNDTNGLTDTFVNGTGSEAPVTGVPTSLLTAYLVNSAGNIVDSSDVSAVGAFSFTNVPPATGYKVILSNTAGLANGTALAASSLPTGWSSTGEVNGNSTVANTETATFIADGISPVFDVTGVNVIDRNFGIEQPPVAGAVVYQNQPNPGNTVTVPVDAGAFTGTLPTVGTALGNVNAGSTNATDATAVTGIKITALPTGATSITINGITYGTGFTAFPATGVTVTLTQLAGMTIDPLDGPVNAIITYVAIDAAGKESAAGTVTLPFNNPGKIDVVKAAGMPKQTGAKTFEIDYNVVVGNADLGPTVYNVQANDNLKRTYPTASTITVSNYAVTAAVTASSGSSLPTCAVATPAFAGTVSASAMLSGTNSLTSGQSCVITFKIAVDFGASPIPSVAQNNTVYASGVGSAITPNPGYIVPDSGVPTAPVVASTTDVSVTAPPTTGAPGTPPAKPTLPTTSGGDAPAGVPTPVTLATLTLTGNVFLDTDGSKIKDATETAAVSAGLNAVLTDATGKVVAVAPVDAAGNYTANVVPGTTYVVTITTNTYAEGSTPASIDVKLPTDYVTTGENLNGVIEAPNTPNSKQTIVVGATNVTNVNFGIAQTASLSGYVWHDKNHDRAFGSGETPVAGVTAEVLNAAGTVIGFATTDATGLYSVTNLTPGVPYSVRFRTASGIILGNPTYNDQIANTQPGTVQTDANGATSEINPTREKLLVKLVAGKNLANQSLPFDPSGVVYDSESRDPIAGAIVSLLGPGGVVVPDNCLVAGINAQTTDNTGAYFYQLINPAPAGCPSNGVAGGVNYTIKVVEPSGFLAPNASQGGVSAPGALYTPAAGVGVEAIQTLETAPGIGVNGAGTIYYFNFLFDVVGGKGIVNNHIPLDRLAGNTFFVSKTGNKAIAEIGDTVMYTVQAKLTKGSLASAQLVDNLPAGFRYILGTATIKGSTSVVDGALADPLPAGTKGPQLTFQIGAFNSTKPVIVTYKVRVGVGAMQGDGINRVQGKGPGGLASNTAQFKVKVTGGVFTNDACVAGKVFVDCNNNHIQDAEELGIPGVRLYMEDGTYFITDVEGKYSYCGISPKTHVLKVDNITLPRGSRLTTTSNRNVGDANSLFLDTKNGELIRGDFAEGSCSNTVLEQVKARRTQGEVRAPETEKKGGPAIKFEGKSPTYPQQGTDSANQRLVKPRGGAGDAPVSETVNDNPVQPLPDSSGNTRGSNLRDQKGGAK
ncbi:MAG: SdrD B-like domain-containing protein [Methylophilaceae bacterium]